MEEYELVILEIPGLEEQIKKFKGSLIFIKFYIFMLLELFEKSNQENSALKSNINTLETRLREIESAHKKCKGEIESLKGGLVKARMIENELENKNKAQLIEIKVRLLRKFKDEMN